MYKCLYWSAYFKVNTIEKAKKLLARFEEISESKVTLISCEKYWKDDSLYDVNFRTDLNKEVISDAVFSALVVAHRLAFNWEVGGPSNHKGKWEFRGLSTKTKVPGIHWIEFRVETESD